MKSIYKNANLRWVDWVCPHDPHRPVHLAAQAGKIYVATDTMPGTMLMLESSQDVDAFMAKATELTTGTEHGKCWDSFRQRIYGMLAV